jgi:hypothetical protein
MRNRGIGFQTVQLTTGEDRLRNNRRASSYRRHPAAARLPRQDAAAKTLIGRQVQEPFLHTLLILKTSSLAIFALKMNSHDPVNEEVWNDESNLFVAVDIE